METKQTPITAVTTNNIKRGIVDRNLTRNALAVQSGISSTSFNRKLDHRPELFTLKDLGDIAEALDVQLVDLITEAA
jgi:DNA-binding Xre family transcriptional regulator